MVVSLRGQTEIIVCPSKLVYQIPCPGCGLTRATIKFLHGNIIEAAYINPNVIFAIIFIFATPIIYIYDYLKKRELLYKIFTKINKILEKPILLSTVIIFESIVWIRNIMIAI